MIAAVEMRSKSVGIRRDICGNDVVLARKVRLPPIPQNWPRTEAEQVRLLGILHFVMAGFGFLALGLLYWHYRSSSTMRNPHVPGEAVVIFEVIYLVFAVMILLTLVCNLFSGYFILQRRHRLFSRIMAAINLFQFPLGTALGLFTFILLNHPSVRETYKSVTP